LIKDMKYKTILLFGAPGAGKGTQGRVLGCVPNYFYFSCGDVFRNLRPEDPLGKKFMEYSSKGELVPDELTVELWRKHLAASTSDGVGSTWSAWSARRRSTIAFKHVSTPLS